MNTRLRNSPLLENIFIPFVSNWDKVLGLCSQPPPGFEQLELLLLASFNPNKYPAIALKILKHGNSFSVATSLSARRTAR